MRALINLDGQNLFFFCSDDLINFCSLFISLFLNQLARFLRVVFGQGLRFFKSLHLFRWHRDGERGRQLSFLPPSS